METDNLLNHFLLLNSENHKGDNYICKDEYFMKSAVLCSKMSKDPSTQVGAVIVKEFKTNNGKITKKKIAEGYNGLCHGISNDLGIWGKNNENELDNKYLYVCHAEANAILNSEMKVRGGIVYTTLYPCSDCAKLIIQSGIKKVIYANKPDKIHNTYVASERLFQLAGIEVYPYFGNRDITITF